MKTTLITILSALLAISAHADRESEEYLKNWCDHQNELDEQRQASARQEAALDDIRWELAERRRQAAVNARERQEAAIAQAEAARRWREQQLAELRRIQQQQWINADEARRRCR